MKNLLKLASYTLLVSLFLVGCRADRETSQSEQSTIQVTLKLGNMTAQIDDEDLRAMKFKWREDGNNLVPDRQGWKDGEIVPVHTAVRTESGDLYGEATLDWRYDAQNKILTLEQSAKGNNIVLSGNGSEVFGKQTQAFYISGIIGGVLKEGRVDIVNERILKATEVTKGGDFKNMDHITLPYAFAWTPLTAELDKKDESGANRQFAYASTRLDNGDLKSVVFKPQGFLIDLNLGSNIDMDIKMQKVRIFSRSFSDIGGFNLRQSVIKEGELPVFEPDAMCPIEYSYEAEPVLRKQERNQLRYYIWAYPTTEGRQGVIQKVPTRVIFRAERQDRKKEITHIYLTDYNPQAGTEVGKKLEDGKVYKLTANASMHLHHPMEYMGAYSLAGGSNYSGSSATGAGESFHLSVRDASNPKGAMSADPYRVQRLFYGQHFIKVAENRTEPKNYPEQKIIDEAGNEITFGDKYRIPEVGDLWSTLFPYGLHANPATGNTLSYRNPNQFFSINSTILNFPEDRMKLGEHTTFATDSTLLGVYKSDWAKRFVQEGGKYVFYGIRFGQAESCVIREGYWGYENNYAGRQPTGEKMIWMPIKDDDMRTAYRYIIWVDAANSSLCHLRIEAVHLGAEAEDKKTELNQISNSAWWTTNSQRVMVRQYSNSIFPNNQYIFASSNSIGITSADRLNETATTGIRWTWRINRIFGFSGYAHLPTNMGTQYYQTIVPYYKQAFLDGPGNNEAWQKAHLYKGAL